ncbi:hypothetical protein K9M09_02760 [Patescibacteria group bacterium]|nr:hypothetical protein [Patescibacteria group bacterium]
MFVKFQFSKQQIDKYFEAAERDLSLADNKETEIKFQFSYNCLLKLTQAVCAHQGLRVKANSGHHIALLDKCAELLQDKKITAVGQAMRDKRNRDLYDGGVVITLKEAETYYKFVKELIIRTKGYLSVDQVK